MKHFLSLLLTIPLFGIAQKEAVLFEPGLISKGGEFGLTLSPDGRNALWVQSNGGRDTLVIMESTNVKGKWQPPKLAPFSGFLAADWKDIDPMYSANGKTLLFESTRLVADSPNRKGFDIWAVKKSGGKWTEPAHLTNIINSDSSESFASMAANGNIYFAKPNDNIVNKLDIYVAANVNGSYLSPKNLGEPVNTVDRESNPFISSNQDYLIYFSDKPGGAGEADLYISYKKNKEWTVPQNLGGNINSPQAEFCPFVNKNQNRLYFSRQVKEGKRFIENIYYYENFSRLVNKLRRSAVGGK